MAKKEVTVENGAIKKAAPKKETTKKAVTKAAPKKATPKKKAEPTIERTRVITAKITIIEQITPEAANEKVTKKDKMEILSNTLKKALKADDVKVSNVQDFLLEK